ncbi:hypothetical protein QTG54_012598 [Skeletonema marinoi]|uniref:Uncharacterized protein n=1 Tax=Skeletonema marinoi TaxID=267567 RepID=A0AAD8Y0A1_9STRA|nr:hypothetical protein QTG54_012598 [Skeletonema marinoi]|mmetsp:Transcript_4292/g.8957  ORF Transcript_4292/g.8957 Transcript_4292/m.8957 type:complete len:155 (+) Transcript_4292:84-548(+)|eukprot:CAMPEP_0113398896 /NCGR_PEP_ID=MMETSP0013_2-20120614/15230_1 /TAXON_ID=2843 ORGANISM="Skeletonema costatum, Strain 1716" /NCGR_SAMPLE_ID=MMETSP0013_2 /ASSEMBLY_ACC=CAM_ASM_000158 /LENGTH=154 /DNA_ID=CAMNT_0000283721 /DNA_START=80 /DNA_END=544 /DNA_ORIENTATION=- /assembly_acc=CAM_ASM_000158
MKITTRRLHLVAAAICSSISCTNSFMLASSSTPVRCRSNALQLSSVPEEAGQQSPAKKNQENIMEMASIAGAEEIAKLDIQERTKRAMLAESVEDRIFELVDELEQIVEKNNGVLEGDAREEAVELAKQTKALQTQYDDLVNGRPSSLLELGKK